ncbi:hypothetical protein TSOC_012118 [Tetrabaena socialis]|uniref:Ubiquitin-like protease family profile domain-containing protein n=1 Tax=Tetrabaena socialis TaxID=47790 RepID=A0A2J7ZNV6_9CHLO|nr:hypothetical protein TSOC_012118 [Tetrabaena socialis]|eukprot:PNH01938.1 hypothetical protein TSOC_012118 [Tetrabaena socialis]
MRRRRDATDTGDAAGDGAREKRRRLQASSHHVALSMCLTRARRAFLTFAAHSLRSAKRRRATAATDPQGAFQQHATLHRAMTDRPHRTTHAAAWPVALQRRAGEEGPSAPINPATAAPPAAPAAAPCHGLSVEPDRSATRGGPSSHNALHSATLDGSSCGVFLCAFAELLARGVPPKRFRFSQADVPALRLGMAEQLLRTAL